MKHVERCAAEMYLDGFPKEIRGPRTVGTEDELLLLDPKTGEAGRSEDFFRFFDHAGWEPYYDDKQAGLFLGYKSLHGDVITTDAGLGTLELNVAPCADLHELSMIKKNLVNMIVDTASRAGLVIFGGGIQPLTGPHENLWQPKERYEIIRNRFSPEVHMATITASLQTHVGISRGEIAEVTTVMNAMTGILVALSANSPIWMGKEDDDGRSAVREEFWDGFSDPCRVGIPERMFSGFHDYLNHFLHQELFVCETNGKYRHCDDTFITFAKKMVKDEDELSNLLKIHEGTVWFDSRPRFKFGTIEVRPCCQQPCGESVPVTALTLGMVENWRKLLPFVSSKNWEFWKELRKRAIHDALSAKVDGHSVRSLAKEVFWIAEEGLKARAMDEEAYLEPIKQRIVSESRVPANMARRVFRSDGLAGLIGTFSYATID